MNVNKQIQELTVLKSELGTLRPTARVYKVQENSQVFFLSDQMTIKSEIEKKLQDLQTNSNVATGKVTLNSKLSV